MFFTEKKKWSFLLRISLTKKLYFSLRKKCPYSELFCLYSVRLQENKDQNNSEYGHLLRSVYRKKSFKIAAVQKYAIVNWSEKFPKINR